MGEGLPEKYMKILFGVLELFYSECSCGAITLQTRFSNTFATQVNSIRYNSIHPIDINWILIMCLSSLLVGFGKTLMLVPSIENLAFEILCEIGLEIPYSGNSGHL